MRILVGGENEKESRGKLVGVERERLESPTVRESFVFFLINAERKSTL